MNWEQWKRQDIKTQRQCERTPVDIGYIRIYVIFAASTLISPIAPKRHGSSVGADLIQPDLQSVGEVGTDSGYTLPF